MTVFDITLTGQDVNFAVTEGTDVPITIAASNKDGTPYSLTGITWDAKIIDAVTGQAVVDLGSTPTLSGASNSIATWPAWTATPVASTDGNVFLSILGEKAGSSRSWVSGVIQVVGRGESVLAPTSAVTVPVEVDGVVIAAVVDVGVPAADTAGNISITGIAGVTGSTVQEALASIAAAAATAQSTADGKVSKGNDTITGRTTWASAEPSIDFKTTAGTAPTDKKWWRWLATAAGALVLNRRKDDGSWSGTDLFTIDANNGVTWNVSKMNVPATSGVGQVAQVSEWDSLTGKIAIAGTTTPSTGWRKVLSWTNGTQDGSNQIGIINTTNFTLLGYGHIEMRRVGPLVEFRSPVTGSNCLRANSTGRLQLFSSGGVPVGWRITDFERVPAASDAALIFIGSDGSGGLRLDVTANDLLNRFRAAWVTANTWPTTQAGLEISSPGT